MKYHILAFGAGFLLDQLFGDPYFLPHPIRGIGWLIAKTEKTCLLYTSVSVSAGGTAGTTGTG